LNQYVFVYVLVGMLCAQSIEQKHKSRETVSDGPQSENPALLW